MGFGWRTNEQKIRINLSKDASLTIEGDMFIFGEKRRSTFINRVLANFFSDARSSSQAYLERQEEELSANFQKLKCNVVTKKEIVKFILAQKKAELEESRDHWLNNKSESKIYRINNKNMEYLTSSECKEEIFYHEQISDYLKCLLEEYASLPYIKRERIFYKERYETAKQAIERGKLLKICTARGKWYHVYPYEIMEDPLSTRDYLVGYVKRTEESRSDKRIASFRLPRLKKIECLAASFRLTKDEIDKIRDKVEICSVQFLVEEQETIRVRLTERGVEKYWEQLHLRPVKDTDASSENEYVFQCTQRQAEYYFFKFGADVEILEPESLRKRFAEMYQCAADQY